jgi:sigma-B regulation protein RsbU (phosphoserine phosphatase)
MNQDSASSRVLDERMMMNDIATGIEQARRAVPAEESVLAGRLEKSEQFARAVRDSHEIDTLPALLPLFRLLSLLNRAVQDLKDPDSVTGRSLAVVIGMLRTIVVHRGGLLLPGLSLRNLEEGEILPPERADAPRPGHVLLVLEPRIAEPISAILNRFDHDVTMIDTAEAFLGAFGFFRMDDKAGTSAERAGTLAFRRAESGCIVTYCRSPSDPRVREHFPDVVVTDIFSARLCGFELQEFLKAFSEKIDTRVIVVSPFAESKCTSRIIQLGADGYFSVTVEPSVFLARVESSIDRRRLMARQQLFVSALMAVREALDEELKRGAEYVRCLLPGKISGLTLSTDWAFVPSARLGGDLFSYNRLSDGRMVMYMIDVSGHGIQSALYSVTIFDALRSENLKNVDFGDPVSVLQGINHAFRMEERNNLLFTLWYGVWDEKTRTLTHSSAGSPPALLILEGGGAVELKTDGMVAGADPEAEYRNMAFQVPRNSRLYLFSDGIYEFITGDGTVLGLEAFIQVLERTVSTLPHDRSGIAEILEKLSSLSAVEHFQDDVSLVEVRFG